MGTLLGEHDATLRRVKAYLEATPGAEAGKGRDLQTFKMACAFIRGFNLPKDIALKYMLDWNLKCSTPWPEKEIRAKLDSALKNGTEPFGSMLEENPPSKSNGSADVGSEPIGGMLAPDDSSGISITTGKTKHDKPVTEGTTLSAGDAGNERDVSLPAGNRTDTAISYRSAGLSIIPVLTNGTKSPACKWAEYQNRLATEDEIRAWCARGYGIAIVGGPVSGNLEMPDFDDPDIIEPWSELVRAAGLGDLLDMMPLVRTPTGGFHRYYRCYTPVEGNLKLASRTVNGRTKTLIETRGEGGYVLAPGCPPECHPSGNTYDLISGDLTRIPTITTEARVILLDCARALDETPTTAAAVRGHERTSAPTGDRPGDLYAAATAWAEILEPAGWTFVGERDGVTDWKRPGKKEPGPSATSNYGNSDVFYVFSTNAAPFRDKTSYSKFAAYALIHHGGNFKAANIALRQKGYGEPPPPTEVPPNLPRSEPVDEKTNTDQLGKSRGSQGAEGDGAKAHEDCSYQWPELKELPTLLPKAPAMPPEIVPEPFRTYLCDIAERMQVPLEIPAVALIAALSGLVGRGMAIHPKREDSWIVVPNTWAMNVGRSGLLKTPAAEEAMKPLSILASKARQEYEANLAGRNVDSEITRMRIEAVKEEMKKALKRGDGVTQLRSDLVVLQSTAGAEKVTEHRYWVNDSTTEKLLELLAENPRGLLVYRDELHGWLRSLDKLGRETDRAFYLESWNGNSPFTCDRIERGTVHVPAVCLALLGSIQPGRLANYVTDALEGGAGDDGLLQRFQLAVFPEEFPTWRLVDRRPDQNSRDRVDRVFRILDTMNPVALGVPLQGHPEIPAIRFDDEAQELFYDWLTKHQNRLLSGTIGSPALESHLSKYRKLMPALSLLFHLAHWADTQNTSAQLPIPPVSVESARLAAGWCDYLEQHARKIYAGALHPGLQAAHTLGAKIKEGKVPQESTVREVYRHNWSGLQRQELVYEALSILQKHDWLRVKTIKGENGRPSELIELNSRLKGKDDGLQN